MRVIQWFIGRGLLYFIKVMVMSVLTGFNFWLAVKRWGWDSGDPVIRVNAVLVAGVTEIGLFAFLILFSEVLYGERRKRSLWGWGIAAVLCILVSLYVNINYFDANWRDAQGVVLIDLLIRSVFLMALLVAVSLIPPKVRKLRTAADVHAEYEAKLAEARLKQELKAIENQQEESRREKRAKERALHNQMLRIAGETLAAQFEVRAGGEIDFDWIGLKDELEGRGLWPVQPTGVATLPSSDDLLRQGVAGKKADGNPQMATQDGNGGKKPLKTHYTIAEAEAETSVPARTIRHMIASGKLPVAEIKGPHGATQLTRKTVEKLKERGNSNPQIAAIAAQNAGKGNGKTSAEEIPTQPRIPAPAVSGNLAVEEEEEEIE